MKPPKKWKVFMLLEMAEQFWTRLPCHAKLSRKEITKFEAKQERQTEK